MSKNAVTLEKHLGAIIKLKYKHLNEKVELIRQMSDKAIDAALTSSNQRLDENNHKYALLKDQNAEVNTKFVTKDEFKSINDKVDLLTKLVYIGMGGLILLELIMKFISK